QVDAPFAVPQRPATISNIGRAEDGLRLETPKARIGLYKSYAASMDEGWTRWIFDQHKVKYASVVDGDIRAGNLRAKYDCIIFPEQGARQIVEGLARNRYPAEVAGGLGTEGVAAIKKFVEEGGTVITFNDSSEFAIEHLGVGVKNVLRGVSNRDFYCPGSILKIEFDPTEALALGAPALEGRSGEGIAWFETGPAFETTGAEARIVARFAAAKDVLLSGWLLGAEKIAGRGAIVEVKRGQGRIIMFAFRPQYRGQTVATLPFLFNAIQSSAPER
ncbi:MAG: peptidase M14, partial [Acidobacteriota bacterium]